MNPSEAMLALKAGAEDRRALLEECVAICERLIAEAQREIDILVREGMHRTAEELWLGRRIGAENVRDAILKELT